MKHFLQNKNFRIAIIAVAALVLAIGAVYYYHTIRIPAYTYERALLDMDNNMFDEALEGFISLEDYKDSKEMVLECQYRKGLWKLQSHQYDEAYVLLASLGDYKDAAEQIRASRLERARFWTSNEEFELAAQVLEGMESDPEVQELLAYKDINDAISTLKTSNKSAGLERLSAVKLNDSLREFIYNKAVLLMQEEDYDTAKFLLLHIVDYRDCETILTENYVSRLVSETDTGFVAYRGSGTSRYIYDEQGRLKETIYGMGSKVYLYEGDEAIGYRSRTGSNMGYLCTYQIERDDRGRVIQDKKVFSQLKGIESVRGIVYQYVYDENGLLSIERHLRENNSPDYQWEYVYSNEGRRMSAAIYTIDPEGNKSENPETTIEYTYDEAGRLIEEKNLKGNPRETRYDALNTKHYHYDALGNLIQLDQYAIPENGNQEIIICSTTYTYEWIYQG